MPPSKAGPLNCLETSATANYMCSIYSVDDDQYRFKYLFKIKSLGREEAYLVLNTTITIVGYIHLLITNY